MAIECVLTHKNMPFGVHGRVAYDLHIDWTSSQSETRERTCGGFPSIPYLPHVNVPSGLITKHDVQATTSSSLADTNCYKREQK